MSVLNERLRRRKAAHARREFWGGVFFCGAVGIGGVALAALPVAALIAFDMGLIK